MVISNPTLPPKTGYVEVEINGVRQYQKVDTSDSMHFEKIENINDIILELLSDHEYRLCMSELTGGENI